MALVQAVLYRSAGLSDNWSDLLAVVAIGTVWFMFSLPRFRRLIFMS